MSTKTTNISLTNGAWTILNDIVKLPAWYAGKDLSIVKGALDLIDRLASFDIKEGDNEWATQTSEMGLSLLEFKSAKACVEFAVKGGALRLTVHVRSLFDEFEVGQQ